MSEVQVDKNNNDQFLEIEEEEEDKESSKQEEKDDAQKEENDDKKPEDKCQKSKFHHAFPMRFLQFYGQRHVPCQPREQFGKCRPSSQFCQYRQCGPNFSLCSPNGFCGPWGRPQFGYYGQFGSCRPPCPPFMPPVESFGQFQKSYGHHHHHRHHHHHHHPHGQFKQPFFAFPPSQFGPCKPCPPVGFYGSWGKPQCGYYNQFNPNWQSFGPCQEQSSCQQPHHHHYGPYRPQYFEAPQQFEPCKKPCELWGKPPFGYFERGEQNKISPNSRMNSCCPFNKCGEQPKWRFNHHDKNEACQPQFGKAPPHFGFGWNQQFGCQSDNQQFDQFRPLFGPYQRNDFKKHSKDDESSSSSSSSSHDNKLSKKCGKHKAPEHCHNRHRHRHGRHCHTRNSKRPF